MAAATTTVSSYVKRFERRGHITRTPNAEDGRSYRLELSAAGRDAHRHAGELFAPVLTHTEIDGLFAVFRRLKAEGKTIIFITHKLEEVMSIADDIAILKRGEIVGVMEAASVSSTRELAEMMVGRPVDLVVDKTPAQPAEPVRQQLLWRMAPHQLQRLVGQVA